MDNSAANKNHIHCPTWLDQNGWSTTSAQGLPMNIHTNSQPLSLGSDSVQRSLFGHLETSNQSCMSDLSSLSSGNNNLLKASNMNSIFSSNSIFSNPPIIAASHGMTFESQTLYTPSGLETTHQAKIIPPPALSQQNQSPLTCEVQNLLLQTTNYKMCQSQLPGLELSHAFQNQSFDFSSCEPNVNMPQATFGEQNNGNNYANISESAISTEQHQWVPSGETGHVDKPPLQENSCPPSTEGKQRRSFILNQRAQLLKQLENLDKLLESMPSDDEEEPSNKDVQSPPAANCSSPSLCDKQSFSDTVPASPLSPAGSEEMDQSCSASEEDSDAFSDYVLQSEVSFSNSQSEDDADSEDCLSPSCQEDDTVKMEENSDDSLSEEENTPSSPKTSEDNEKYGKVEIETSKAKNGHSTTKRNYCLFCGRPVTKMSKHLTNVHSDRLEVAVVFQYPANSVERRKIWQKLTNDGNFKHNKDVLKTGEGKLVVRGRLTTSPKATDFVPCIYCHGLYQKRSIHLHMKRCRENLKTEDDSQEIPKRVVSHCALLTKNCEGISEEFKNLIGVMVYDNVSETVMENRIILQYGEQMFKKYISHPKQHEYARQNLRHVARLLLEAQKSTPMKSFEDFFKPSNFKHVVSAVKVMGQYDPEKKRYNTPSLALKLGYHLKKICNIVQNNAKTLGDTKVVESCKIFLSMYDKKWTKYVSSVALSNIKDMQKKRANKVPSAQDVKRLYYHLETAHHTAEKKLRENLCSENFAALARVVLARTILFNRRLPGEVASISLAAFESRIRSDVCDDMDVSVTKLERKLCGLFSRVTIRGNCGRVVPIILKPSFESSMEFLISVREKCGILSNNPYVFSRQHSLTAQKGSSCIQCHVKECGAENPSLLVVMKIRRHFAPLLQLLNLDDEEVKQVLGPNSDIQVLRQINDTMCDDSVMESEGPLQFYQQRRGATGCSMPDALKNSKAEGLHSQSKCAWNKAEVQAVEKHLMSFIKKHKIPQKDDCVQCLEAEPHALMNRSWKSVKYYVRNRITTLRRQTGSSKELSKSRIAKKKHKPWQSSVTSEAPNGEVEAREKSSAGPSSASGLSMSEKGNGSNSLHKPKPKWSEAEVCAVERHLMRFIEEHKLPQKDDCTRCLEAEPCALKNRSWKGIKDYVRNRITSLQRRSGSSKAPSKTKKKSRKRTSQSSRKNSMRGLQPPSGEQPAPEHQDAFSSCSFGSSNLFLPQTHAATTSCSMNAPAKPRRTREKASPGLQKKSKHMWNEAEVQAVEKHLMNFITKQKIPQKDDCVRCLDAEPHALKNRCWKGVKDYVRNRITSLQRQSGSLGTASKTKRSRQGQPHKSSGQDQQL
ncbi:uncharacterized protein LOC129366153 isoform X2 [Poeciliopsis prolifica]|uniref:uncharacterized protein LOC129366153 isoform X2 n=1 Tax=Poeciliopsis prolifica TaxID=188132 RepID=UPI00241383DF|nr:uncharacterized protein LOC129366153 isoform X2 [Poeciliopsis prolifica]